MPIFTVKIACFGFLSSHNSTDTTSYKEDNFDYSSTQVPKHGRGLLSEEYSVENMSVISVKICNGRRSRGSRSCTGLGIMKPPITSGIPSRPLSRCDADHPRLDLGCSSNFSRRATNLSSLVSVADLTQETVVLCMSSLASSPLTNRYFLSIGQQSVADQLDERRSDVRCPPHGQNKK